MAKLEQRKARPEFACKRWSWRRRSSIFVGSTAEKLSPAWSRTCRKTSPTSKSCCTAVSRRPSRPRDCRRRSAPTTIAHVAAARSTRSAAAQPQAKPKELRVRCRQSILAGRRTAPSYGSSASSRLSSSGMTVRSLFLPAARFAWIRLLRSSVRTVRPNASVT